MQLQENKIALITGASRGIGKAVALGLAQDGYRVCLLSRNRDALELVAKEIIEKCQSPSHLAPLIFACDVSDVNAIKKAVDEIIKQCGHIDIVLNNAGILRQGILESVQDFNELVQVNLIGAFNILHAVVPHMKKRQQGYIFNLASICGKEAYTSFGAYSATKFGLVGLSESLFNELAPHHVKVTAICPSYVATDMSSHAEYPPANLMIAPEDILKIMRGLLTLSSQACVKEVVIHCQAAIT